MAARIFGLILIALEIRSIPLSVDVYKLRSLAFYTRLSNIAALISSLLLCVFGQSHAVTVLRYLAVSMMVMTFFVTAFVLVPMGADAKRMLWSGSGLYHHILCPVITTFSYLVLEDHARAGFIWLPAAVTLGYGLTMLYLNWKKIYDGPYPFFKVHEQTAAKTVMWVAVLLASVTLISTFVWFASTLFAH